MDIPHMRPDKSLPMPRRAHLEDAGSDLYALEDTIIWPLQTKAIEINSRVVIPPGYFACVTGRSGLAKRGLLVHQGTVDAGYTGVIKVIATNVSPLPLRFKRGDRVAQLVVHNLCSYQYKEVDELPETARGDNGLGSTGRR